MRKIQRTSYFPLEPIQLVPLCSASSGISRDSSRDKDTLPLKSSSSRCLLFLFARLASYGVPDIIYHSFQSCPQRTGRLKIRPSFTIGLRFHFFAFIELFLLPNAGYRQLLLSNPDPMYSILRGMAHTHTHDQPVRCFLVNCISGNINRKMTVHSNLVDKYITTLFSCLYSDSAFK